MHLLSNLDNTNGLIEPPITKKELNMLERRPNSECCDKDLPPESNKAVIGLALAAMN